MPSLEDLMQRKKKKKIAVISSAALVEKINTDVEKARKGDEVPQVETEKITSMFKKMEEQSGWASQSTDEDEEFPIVSVPKTPVEEEPTINEEETAPVQPVDIASTSVWAAGGKPDDEEEPHEAEKPAAPAIYTPPNPNSYIAPGGKPKVNDTQDFPTLGMAATQETPKPVKDTNEQIWHTAGRGASYVPPSAVQTPTPNTPLNYNSPYGHSTGDFPAVPERSQRSERRWQQAEQTQEDIGWERGARVNAFGPRRGGSDFPERGSTRPSADSGRGGPGGFNRSRGQFGERDGAAEVKFVRGATIDAVAPASFTPRNPPASGEMRREPPAMSWNRGNTINTGAKSAADPNGQGFHLAQKNRFAALEEA